MNSPYNGDFYVSNLFTLGYHDGLDLVGVTDKKIHSTVNGTVCYSGWENPDNHSQGFGLYVCIRFMTEGKEKYAYFGHLKSTNVQTGDKVKITDTIGEEGSTGLSTGPHCHYEIRDGFFKGAKVTDICAFSGIKNTLNILQNDGYVEDLNHVTSLYQIPTNCKITKTPNKNEIIITW